MTGSTEREHCTECGESVEAYCKFVLASKGFDLWYCAHHSSRYEEALVSKGFVLTIDRREELEKA